MKVDAAYITVTDRDRAEAYWKKVFQSEPVMKNETFSFFDIGGFLLGLFDPSNIDEKISYGNNCVLNLHVDDADLEAKRIGQFSKIVMPPSSVGPYRLFQIEDTEGNIVEFYSQSTAG